MKADVTVIGKDKKGIIAKISAFFAEKGANILDIKNEIAMLTFTTEAATNMKSRLKQAFMNYFVFVLVFILYKWSK